MVKAKTAVARKNTTQPIYVVAIAMALMAAANIAVNLPI